MKLHQKHTWIEIENADPVKQIESKIEKADISAQAFQNLYSTLFL